MPTAKSIVYAAVPAVLVGAVAAGLWMRHAATEARHGSDVAAMESANRDLRGRVSQLEAESAELREKLAAQGIEVAPSRSAPAVKSEATTSYLETVRMLAQVQGKLASANSAITDLQEKTREMEASIAKLSDENRRLSAESAEFKENLASSTRVVQAMEAELKSKAERVMELEAAVRRARDESASASQKGAQVAPVLKELDDINRRRENTLTSLQRRYRDLTDQYRALAVRLDTQRDNPTTLTTDVSRIQSTVQSAEDELRQLIALNTLAQRAAQKLPH